METFMFILLLGLFISLAFNFKSMLDFKWHIDYMIQKDAVCNDYTWTKFEIETFRYNLSQFLYKHDEFKAIVNNYTISFWLIVIIVVSTILVYMYLFVKSFSYAMSNISISILFFIILVSIMINTSIYMSHLKHLESLSHKYDDKDHVKSLSRYYYCYKILGAIIVITKLKDTKVELSHPVFTKLSLKFDELLERNIASYENTNNTSKLKNIKLNAYDKLDFLKYFVFDQLSPYYLKYFDNVYVRVPSLSAGNDITFNMYLDDLYTKHLNHNTQDKVNKINVAFKEIKSFTINNSNPYNLIIPDQVPEEERFNIYLKIKDLYNRTEKSDATVTQNLQILETLLQYDEINQKIKSIINKSGDNVIVDGDDYIKYFIDNKDVLFENAKIADFKNKLFGNVNIIYAYYFYFSVFFFMFSHYLYNTLNGSTYIYTLLGIIVFYILFIWMYTQVSLMMVTAY
jgi:hypothetical protein